MRRPFKGHSDGVAVRLSEVERQFLLGLPDLLASVDGAPEDPAHQRLHVAAYPDDPAAQEEMTEYSGSQLAEERATDRTRFTATLEAEQSVLSPEEAESWLTVLGDTPISSVQVRHASSFCIIDSSTSLPQDFFRPKYPLMAAPCSERPPLSSSPRPAVHQILPPSSLSEGG